LQNTDRLTLVASFSARLTYSARRFVWVKHLLVAVLYFGYTSAVKIAKRAIVFAVVMGATVPAQPPFRVGGLALDAPPKLSGDCGKSTRVHYSGRINATGPGDVTYEWIRSDNAKAPAKTLHFSHSGPLPITYDWSVKGSATGWVAFRILSPNPIQSNKVPFRINCRY